MLCFAVNNGTRRNSVFFTGAQVTCFMVEEVLKSCLQHYKKSTNLKKNQERTNGTLCTY